MNEEIKKYVTGERSRGMNDESIKAALLASGWNEADVDMVLREPTPVPEPRNQSPTDASFYGKWSFAAFFGTWVWLFINKQKKMGAKFFFFWLALIFANAAPWLGIAHFSDISSTTQGLQLVWFGFSVWLGVKGREIVWKSGVWDTPEIFEQQQKKANTWVTVYVVTFMVASFLAAGMLFQPYIDDPKLLEGRVKAEILQKAQSSDPTLDVGEFDEGYAAGIADGALAGGTAKVSAEKTKSYRTGYNNGFAVSCMRIQKNDAICVKQILSGSESTAE